MLEILDFAGRPIASEHDLLVRLVEGVERVEEFLLDALFSGQKLNVVNEQDVGLAIFFAKARELIVLNGINVLVRKFFRGEISDARTLFVRGNVLAYCVKQMCFAQTDAAI